MTSRPLALTLILSAALACLVAEPARSAVEGKETALRVEGPNKLLLKGVLVAPLDLPEGRRAPVVVMLHSMARTREDFDDLINALNARGILALAADLRGHGHSRRTTDNLFVSYPHLAPRDFRKMVGDQKLVVDWLAERPEVDMSRIAMVGVGLGTLVGAQAAGGDPRVGALALVGPMDRAMGLTADPGMVAMGDRPVWLATSKANTVWMGIAERLADLGSGERTVAGYDAVVSTTTELLAIPELAEDLTEWLSEKLAAKGQ
jgi:pimeloyl-ACP methyl ester carboxylesterase